MQTGAAECVAAIVDKRMEAPQKFALLSELRPLDAIARLDLSNADVEFLSALASLTSSIGNHALAAADNAASLTA